MKKAGNYLTEWDNYVEKKDLRADIPGVSSKVTFNIAGYLEADWSDSLEKIYGSVIIQIQYVHDQKWQGVIWVIPVTADVKFTASGDATFRLGYDFVVPDWFFKIELAAAVAIEPYGAIGFGDFASAGVYGNGKVEFSSEFTLGKALLEEVTLSGEAGAKAYFACSEVGTWVFVSGEHKLYPKSDADTAGIQERLAPEETLFTGTDGISALSDMDYVNEISEWNEDNGATAYAAANADNVLINNAYAASSPQTATVTYYGKNGYSGKLKKTYKIVPFDIEKNEGGKAEYDKTLECFFAKGGAKPKPAITFDGKALKEGTDYTLSYKNNMAASGSRKPCVTISGRGNFKGKVSIDFTIKPQDLLNVKLAPCDKMYKNKPGIYKITPKLVDLDGKALSAGKDFDKNSIEYTYEEAVSFKDGSTKNAKVAFKKQYAYTGEAIEIKPEDITVTLAGEALAPGEFVIDPATNNNKAKGRASITIKGAGEIYGGSKTVAFTIAPRGFSWCWRRK